MCVCVCVCVCVDVCEHNSDAVNVIIIALLCVCTSVEARKKIGDQEQINAVFTVEHKTCQRNDTLPKHLVTLVEVRKRGNAGFMYALVEFSVTTPDAADLR